MSLPSGDQDSQKALLSGPRFVSCLMALPSGSWCRCRGPRTNAILPFLPGELTQEVRRTVFIKYERLPAVSTRRGRSPDSVATRPQCVTATCALPKATLRHSMPRARAQELARAPEPTASTLRGRSRGTPKTRAMWFTASCGLLTAPSPVSIPRAPYLPFPLPSTLPGRSPDSTVTEPTAVASCALLTVL